MLILLLVGAGSLRVKAASPSFFPDSFPEWKLQWRRHGRPQVTPQLYSERARLQAAGEASMGADSNIKECVEDGEHAEP